jgi:hypothetical protein
MDFALPKNYLVLRHVYVISISQSHSYLLDVYKETKFSSLYEESQFQEKGRQVL